MVNVSERACLPTVGANVQLENVSPWFNRRSSRDFQGSKTSSPQNVVDEDGNVVGDVCPEGHYCTEGTVNPFACPSGTYSSSVGNTELDACLPCPPGYVCPDAGTAVATEPCPAGYYCPEGKIVLYPLAVSTKSDACGLRV